MSKQNAGGNAKKLRDSRNQSVSPKKFKSMSPERSQNSGEKLWNAFYALMNVTSELEETKFTMELKKDTEISEEQLNKIIALKKQVEEEVEQITIPYLKKIVVELKGTRIEKLSMELKELVETQGKKVQNLCKKLKSGTGTAEDQNKLDSTVGELVEEYSEKFISYVPDSNPVMLYTAVIGVGLAAGLLVSTALDHTTKLSTLAIIGITTAFALIAGGATYQALRPRTEANESRVTHISGNSYSFP